MNGVKYKKQEMKMGKEKSAETPRPVGVFFFFIGDYVKEMQARQAIEDGVKCLAEHVNTSAASEKPVMCKRNKAK